jgi:hypothetical protein
LPLDGVAIVSIIRERGMDVREAKLGKVRYDFIGAPSQELVPNIDVLHSNPRPDDARFTAAHAGFALDVLDD